MSGPDVVACHPGVSRRLLYRRYFCFGIVSKTIRKGQREKKNGFKNMHTFAFLGRLIFVVKEEYLLFLRAVL